MSVDLTLIQDVGPTRRKLMFFCPETEIRISMRYIRIFKTMYAIAICYNEEVSVGPILIDDSYDFDEYVFRPIKASPLQYTVLIDYHTPVSYATPYHGVVFDTDPENRIIDEYVISNLRDCGIDIVFRHEYIIESKGTLVIKLPLVNGHFDHSDKPNFFILRSRYANRCKLYYENSFLHVVNNSEERIRLGNRFVQMVFPACQNFDKLANTIKKLDNYQNYEIMHSILLNNKKSK